MRSDSGWGLALLVLLLLLGAGIVLAVLACVPGRDERVRDGRVGLACRAVCGSCAGLGLAALAGGLGTASLTLPFGLPGASAVVSIDVVSLAFLPAVGAALAADGRAGLAAAALLLLCAGDASLVAVAAALTAFAAGWRGGAAVLALLVALALGSELPAGLWPQDALSALRGQGADGWLVLGAIPGLMLAGSGRSGAAVQTLGVLVSARVLLDLPDGSLPSGWGLSVAALALALAVERGVRAVRSATVDGVLGALSGVGFLLASAGVGIASAARAADLGEAASAAMGGVLLLVWVLAVAVPLGEGAARRVAEGAGSRRLAALGGLTGPMRWTSLACVASLASVAAVPGAAGFAPVWLLMQALFSAQRFGGIAAPVVLASLLACAGLALGLAMAAAARLWIVAFAGRPRSPRGAASYEPAGAGPPGLAVAAGVLLVLSLVPGLAVRLVDPAVAALTGTAMGARAGLLSLSATATGTAYWPLMISLVIAGAVAGLWRAGRRLGWREVAAWDAGAGPAPEWLPFGEPLAQPGGPGVARPVMRALGLASRHVPGEGRAAHDAPAGTRVVLAGLLRAARGAGSVGRSVETRLAGASPVLCACLGVALVGLVALRAALGPRP